jgi:hypothetical protein
MNDQAPSPEGGETRLAQGGEAATTRFGMEDGDNTDVPATGLDPAMQSGGSDKRGGADPEEEAAKLGDFA